MNCADLALLNREMRALGHEPENALLAVVGEHGVYAQCIRCGMMGAIRKTGSRDGAAERKCKQRILTPQEAMSHS